MTDISTVKDSYIRSDNGDTNYETVTPIRVIQNFGGIYGYALIEFNISGYDVADITSCVLNFYVTGGSGGTSQTLYASRITSSWTESGVTWNTQPSFTATNEGSSTFDHRVATWRTIDVTSTIKDQSGSTFGVLIRGKTGVNWLCDISSREGANTAYISIIRNRRFVKTGGNDASDGTTWAAAWATINKAANTLTDGQDCHIEGGIYDAEPAANDIAPVNAGTTGIKYTVWGTAGSGDANGTGTGTVTVEKNA